jgi:hypothetical protein
MSSIVTDTKVQVRESVYLQFRNKETLVMEMRKEGLCISAWNFAFCPNVTPLFMVLLPKKILGSLSIGKVRIVGSHSPEIKCLVPSLMCRLSKEGLIL